MRYGAAIGPRVAITVAAVETWHVVTEGLGTGGALVAALNNGLEKNLKNKGETILFIKITN